MGLTTADTDQLGLRTLCTPRTGLAEQARSDTVADLADLLADRIPAESFFAETHVTAGMEALLKPLFGRLTGSSEQGVFRLKQAMGGGKTHNLIAAGLLARHPALRRRVLSAMGMTTDERTIRLAAFSGRETDLKDSLWVHLARQLGRADRFEGATADPPGPATWAKVIGSEPTLILLDEMPPFFVSLASKTAGPGTTEADRLALALANLMVAILNNRLPNCCLVVSDLTGSWEAGSVRIQSAIDNATAETSRAALDIVPVRMDGNELYAILRTRLFERLPPREAVARVPDAYAAAYRLAVQQGVVPALHERWAYDILDTYPFHPGLQELFARFRENPGFQQTREMLRLARRMVLGLWNGPDTGERPIHPHHLDFGDGEVEALVNAINPSLANARANDVAKRGAATAEKLAHKAGDTAVSDAARLLYLSSLATPQNALRGLTAEEAAAYLAAPGRDVSRVNDALLTELEEYCWYLHRRKEVRGQDGQPLFRSIRVNLHGEDDADALVMPNGMAAAYAGARRFCERVARRGTPAAGILKTLLLRRIGSSLRAGPITAERLLDRERRVELALEDEEPAGLGLDEEIAERAEDYEPEADERALLEEAVEELRNAGNNDPKLQRCIHALRDDGWAERGCILFSQYCDTVEWFAGQIARTFPGMAVGVYAGLGRTCVITGGDRQRVARTDIQERVKDRTLKLLIATDAASEGLNLQRLQTLINIDLPWNPSRLEQRKGRIERIGQVAEAIDILNLRYRGSVEDQVHAALSGRLKDIQEVFGTLPDMLEDVWIDAALGDMEAARRLAGAVPRHPFEIRYTTELRDVDWNRCEQVLNRHDLVDVLRAGWRR